MYMCMYKTREATREEKRKQYKVARPTKKYTICTHGTKRKRKEKKQNGKMLTATGWGRQEEKEL